MFTARWRVCRLLGIPIYLDASWLIILVLLTLSLARGFPELTNETFPETTLDPGLALIMGIVTALAFFVCLLLHELGHAVVARARGMSIRGITLFMFGGVAELGEEPESASTEFLMAIGGPVVSIFLALIFGLATWVGFLIYGPPPIVMVLLCLAIVNASVLVFNLIPAFPLDGGRVVRSALWAATGNLLRATYWASLGGRIFAFFLITMGIMQFFGENWQSGIWTGLMGLFLNNAARSSYQQVLLRQTLRGEPVGRLMNTQPIAVSPHLDLRHWVEDYVYRFHRKTFPVVTEGHIEGCINTGVLADIPKSEWSMHTVSEFMKRDLAGISISPDADALEALDKMQQTGCHRLLVLEGDHLVGIVSLKDLLRYLNLKMEQEHSNNNHPGDNHSGRNSADSSNFSPSQTRTPIPS